MTKYCIETKANFNGSEKNLLIFLASKKLTMKLGKCIYLPSSPRLSC